jgi:uridine kinase
LGGADAASKLYAERYRAAFDLYESLCDPSCIADVLLNNDDLERPKVVVRSGSLLAAPHSS